MTGSAAAPQPGPVRRDVDGILLLDKPGGITSNRALQRARGILRARKAGHCGSLDPLATGMLPICFGEATKVSGWMLGAGKTYRVRARFGSRTDTGDAQGRVVAELDGAPTRAALEEALTRFVGTIRQVPPMYSALKQGGRRLYELARAGETVERQPRAVEIRELVVEVFDPVAPVLRVRCGKGTYIRSLVEDLAADLGFLAHVAELRRLQVDPFQEAAMVTLEQLEEAAAREPAAAEGLLLPVDAPLSAWPRICLDAAASRCIRQGQTVSPVTAAPPGLVRLYDDADRFLGVGAVGEDGAVAPRRLLRVA